MFDDLILLMPNLSIHVTSFKQSFNATHLLDNL